MTDELAAADDEDDEARELLLELDGRTDEDEEGLGVVVGTGLTELEVILVVVGSTGFLVVVIGATQTGVQVVVGGTQIGVGFLVVVGLGAAGWAGAASVNSQVP